MPQILYFQWSKLITPSSLTFTVFISPELREKREAAGKLVMGTVTKIVLRFRERFWEKNR